SSYKLLFKAIFLSERASIADGPDKFNFQLFNSLTVPVYAEVYHGTGAGDFVFRYFDEVHRCAHSLSRHHDLATVDFVKFCPAWTLHAEFDGNIFERLVDELGVVQVCDVSGLALVQCT